MRLKHLLALLSCVRFRQSKIFSCRSQQQRLEPVQVSLVLASGGTTSHWRERPRAVKPGCTAALLRWFGDQLATGHFEAHRGFDVAQALIEATELSRGTLPIWLLCGALTPGGIHRADHEAALEQVLAVQQTAAHSCCRYAFITDIVSSMCCYRDVRDCKRLRSVAPACHVMLGRQSHKRSAFLAPV